jgi:beta-glucanase (GH16 family)
MVPRTARRRRPHRAEIRRARRRRQFVALAVVVVVALVAIGFLVTREDTTSAAPQRGALLLDESFSGTGLNPNRWSPCYHWATDGCTNLSNNELEWYVPEQVKVSDGVLSLEADRRTVIGIDDRPFDYVSGLISGASPDADLFAFKYGYVESRVHLPNGQGLWSALWMLPTTRESKPEVDIFETIGEEPDAVQMHTHWSADGEDHQRGHKWHSGDDLTEGWHTFGLQWEPNSLTWYVDGEARWRVTDPDQIPHEDMYLVTNLAVGGALTKTPNADTPFPSSLKVDYIRVWGLP